MTRRAGGLVLLAGLVLAGGCALTDAEIAGIAPDRQAAAERALAELAARLGATETLSTLPIYMRLREFMDRHPELHGAGLAYAPGMAPGTAAALAAPYVWREAGMLHDRDLARDGDYARDDAAWYHEPVQEDAMRWTDVTYDFGGLARSGARAACGLPLHRFQRTPRLLGVAFVDLAAE
ncbi:MAG TPA: hypothetical protein PKM88_07650 [bacterium]|nr:hypothetical protein [bacterium]